MTVIETWATDDATVEVHDTPPECYDGDSTNLGHLKAHNSLALVTMTVSKALLDDDPMVKHYVKTRLLRFLRLETDRVKAAASGT